MAKKKKDSLPPRLVDAAGFASTLGVSSRTLARMVKNGSVPAPMEFGRLRRWHPSVVTETVTHRQKGGRR